MDERLAYPHQQERRTVMQFTDFLIVYHMAMTLVCTGIILIILGK